MTTFIQNKAGFKRGYQYSRRYIFNKIFQVRTDYREDVDVGYFYAPYIPLSMFVDINGERTVTITNWRL